MKTNNHINQDLFNEALLNSISDSIITTDLEGKIIYWNRAAEKLYKWKSKEVIGKNIIEVTSPTSTKKQAKEIMNSLKNGESWEGEFEVQDKNGKTFPVYVKDSPLLDSKGNLIGIIGSSRDITNRKKAEKEADEKEIRFRELFSNVNDAIFIFDPDNYEILEANEATSKLYGYSHKELIGMSCLKFSAEVDKSKAVAKSIKNQKKLKVNLRHHKKKDGSDIFLELSTYNITVGGKNVFYSVCHDITDRQKAEQKLKENERKFKIFADNTFDWEYWIDPSGNYIYISPACEEITGYRRDEFMNDPDLLFEITSPQFKKQIQNHYNPITEKGPHTEEFKIINKNKEQVWIEHSCVPVYDENGIFRGRRGINRNITERKNVDNALKEQYQYLEKLNNSLGSVVFTVDIENRKIEYVNNRVKAVFGYNPDECIGNTTRFLYPNNEAFLDYGNQMQKAIQNNQEFLRIENILKRKNGQLFNTDITTSFLSNTKVVAVITDITNRKKAEQELKESEKKHRSLFENSIAAITFFDADFKLVMLNEANASLLGGKREDFIGKSIYELFPDVADLHVKRFKKIISNGKTEIFEDAFNLPNGTKWFSSLLQPTYNTNQQFEGIQIISIEITDKKRAEQALKESEEKFKLLNRLTSEMLLLQDMESIYKFIAENLQKLHPNTIVLNVSIDESIQQSRLEVISGLDNSLLAKVIKISGFNPIGKKYKLTDIHNNYFRSGDFIEFEGGLAEFSASEFPAVEASAIEKLIGLHKIYTIGINKDDGLLAAIHFFTFNKQVISNGNFIELFAKQAGLVLQKKTSEKALIKAKEKAEESEKQLRLISDNFVKGMIYQVAMLDENRRQFNYISKNVEELYGCTAEEAKKDANLIYGKIHPDDIDGLTEKEKDALKRMSTFETEARIFTPDGNIRWAYYISKPRIIDGVVCWDGIEIDITERKQMEFELRKAKEKAEESDLLKSAFLANMSHEIRTPMNGIMGFTNLLQEHNLTGEQQQHYVEIIRKSGERMLNTVNDIIEISKIETGQIKVSTAKVNISKHLKTLHNFFTLEASKKGLELILDNKLSEDESLINTDKSKLSSILTNLIKNAIKFTENGFIKIGCKKNDKLLELYVEDSGMGIPADRKDAIFNRFEQADIEDKAVHEGSGLGLAITKSYVEMLGGEIWVESEENKWSTFFFTIPYNPVKTKTKSNEVNKKQDKHKVKKLNILIVEDDEISAQYLSTILNNKAENIQIAKDGVEAVEVCKNNTNFDLILMDVKLPGIDGLEATQRIRKFNKNIKIIAQTAHALEGDNEKAIKAGCNGYISKPIEKEKLVQMIEKYL